MQNYNSKSKIIIFLLIFTFYFLLFNSPKANAQSVSLGIYPPIVQVMIQPGKTLTQVYKVYNNADPVIVSSEISPFVGEDEGGAIKLVDCKQVEVIGCESLSWFSFQNANLELGKSFFLGSGRNQEAVLKISVPDYASEGDYYNSLLFTSQAPPSTVEKSSRVTATIGSNILITVSKDGNPNRTIEITEFSAKSVIFDSFESIPVILRVRNSGNAYTPVSGKIYLNGFPGLTSNFSISPQNILAGRSRILQATPSATLTTNYSLVLPKGFYLGKYSLKTEVQNEDGVVKKAQTSFYALPFRFVIATILVLLFLAVILKLSRKFSITLLLLLIYTTIYIKPTQASVSSHVGVSATVGQALKLFGYSSPSSVVGVTGQSLSEQVEANQFGYFEFPSLYILPSTKELCLLGTDRNNRSTNPFCIPSPEFDNNNHEIGPVILSPTLSLARGSFFSNQTVEAEGESVPNSEIVVSIFKDERLFNTLPLFEFNKPVYATTLPEYTIKTDQNGYFSFNLPSLGNNQYRLFSQVEFNKQPSPKSNTLTFTVVSLIYFLKLLVVVLFIILLVTVIIRYIKKESKPKSIVVYLKDTVTF